MGKRKESLMQRVRKRMHELRINQAEFARLMGVSSQVLQNWIKRDNMPGKYWQNAALQLQLSLPELIANISDGQRNDSDDKQGIDRELAQGNNKNAVESKIRPGFSNISPGPIVKRLVPLISWEQVGTWNEAMDTFPPGDSDKLFPCPVPHGPNTYVLLVKDDTMTSPHGKSYPQGALIFVDPDQTDSVVSGDRVIASLEGDDMVTFKVYVVDAGRKFLKPLNPSYPIITDPFKILGKVIGQWTE